MCGIVGLWHRSESVSPHDVSRMCDTIVHRGPDGHGQHIDGRVGIGMRRLSIIDLDGGWQPISNESGDIHVVQNGEIYNYRELRTELEQLGHHFKTASDTEVIVHAYEQWGGHTFATKLRGMFGIAVWDSRKQELWLARDRLGIKPLFYFHNDAGFAFASEVKAVLASPISRRELNPAAISDYLAFGSADVDTSFFKNVHQLLPGTVMRVRKDLSMQRHRYWEFKFPSDRLSLTEDEAEEALYAKLKESVKSHLVSDVPVGAFLSGGVDSSAIVGVAAELGAKLKTFSIGFDEQEFNELPYAREVAKKWGCEHHEEIVRPDAAGIIDKLVDQLDEPFADASAIPTWIVSQLAAQHVKVVLSGDGGDETFAGYQRFQVAANRLYLDRIPFVLRRFGGVLGRSMPSFFPGKYFLDCAAKDRAARYAMELCPFPPIQQQQLLRPEVSPAALGVQDPVRRSAEKFRQYGAGDYLSNCMQFDTTRYLPMDILVKVDRMTMAHSLEARPPLLDHEFVEFAASLQTSLKFREPNEKKYLLRKVAHRVVPKHVIERKKAGFSVPLQHWFAGPLADMFHDSVLADGRCLDYLNPHAISTLVSENAVGRRDHGLKLWAILMLELWLRRLASTQSVEPAVATPNFAKRKPIRSKAPR